MSELTLMQYIGKNDREDTPIYEGDIIEITGATCNEINFVGEVFFTDGTFCLKRLKQSSEALKHGYTDLVTFWSDGCHDHYSLEMIDDFEIKVIGNIYGGTTSVQRF